MFFGALLALCSKQRVISVMLVYFCRKLHYLKALEIIQVNIIDKLNHNKIIFKAYMNIYYNEHEKFSDLIKTKLENVNS